MVAWYAFLLAFALFEIVRATHHLVGIVFADYVRVGEAVLQGGDPYAMGFNTWPPFFLFVEVVLALAAHALTPTVAVMLWQLLSVLATWGTLKVLARLFLDDGARLTFWPRGADRLAFTSAGVLIPLLLLMRILQENLQHAQVNGFLVYLVALAFWLFRERRPSWGGLALALAASLKATPIAFLPYLVYKRAWREAGWTTAFLILLNVALPVAVFGPAGAAAHWRGWWFQIGAQTGGTMTHYYNQSLLAALDRLLGTGPELKNPVFYAVAGLSHAAVRKVFDVAAAALALGLAVVFWKNPPGVTSRAAAGEMAVALGALALVDPLAWKAHYVALLATAFYAWSAATRRAQRALILASAALLTVSAPALVGFKASAVLESYSIITLGALGLVAAGTWLHLVNPERA
jgi:hypothetical protein